MFRKQVLSLYRRILRLSRTWEAVDPAQTPAEREYITTEARTLFKQNKNVSPIKLYYGQGNSSDLDLVLM